jgi:hypothetical protein
MKYILAVIIMGLTIAVTSSCRSTKTIQTAIAKKDTVRTIPVPDPRADSMAFIKNVLDTVRRNYISDYQTFNAKIKVDFEGNDGQRNNVNAFVRLKKDSVIWITINALLGIDAFRVLITPDSVKVVDKLKKTVSLRSVEYLQEVTGIPITFKELQDLLIGNPLFLDSSNISSYKKDDRNISLVSIGAVFKHFLTVNKDDYTVQHSKLDDVDPVRARTADITYGDYEYRNGIHFSTYRRITVSEKSKLDIEMQYKQFEFNGALSFPFSIPRNYKRK